MLWVYGYYKYFSLPVRGPSLDIQPLQRRDRLYTSESDVCRRQILMYKDNPAPKELI